MIMKFSIPLRLSGSWQAGFTQLSIVPRLVNKKQHAGSLAEKRQLLREKHLRVSVDCGRPVLQRNKQVDEIVQRLTLPPACMKVSLTGEFLAEANSSYCVWY